MAYGSSPITYESDLSHRPVTDRPHEFPNFQPSTALVADPVKGRAEGRKGDFFESKTRSPRGYSSLFLVASLGTRFRFRRRTIRSLPGINGTERRNRLVELAAITFDHMSMALRIRRSRARHEERIGIIIISRCSSDGTNKKFYSGRHVRGVGVSVVEVISR